MGRGEALRIANREITDECTYCGNILQCELFRQGHVINNITEVGFAPTAI